MRAYLHYLRDILENGRSQADRTDTGTLRVSGRKLRFDLSEGFPLVTTKRVWFKGVPLELLWFLSGETSIRPLVERGVTIWTDWPLRRVDQISDVDREFEVAAEEECDGYRFTTMVREG